MAGIITGYVAWKGLKVDHEANLAAETHPTEA